MKSDRLFYRVSKCKKKIQYLDFYTPVFRRDVLWYGDVRPSVRPGLRPSVRHSFPHFSPTCFDILIWNFVYHFIFKHVRSRTNAINFHHFLQELCSFLTSNSSNMQFSALFSYMLWHIELKFCIWLCFTVLQIKLECRQFASIFVGVMPLLERRILEIHSFPHFSLTSFNILSWKFAYYFIFLYYRSSLSVVNLGLFWSYASFRTCIDKLSWI